MKHYRVKYGYGRDEFISIDETELPKALKAQVKGQGSMAFFNEGSVNGDKIMAVLPDFQRDMGLNRDYQLSGEDYAQIGPVKQREYSLLLEDTKLALQGKTTERPALSAQVKAIAASKTV